MVKPAAIDRAADVAGIDLVAVGTLADQIHADFEIGDQLGAALAEHFQRTADVVAVSVRQQNMRDPLRRSFPATRPGRIADQVGIDENLGRRLVSIRKAEWPYQVSFIDNAFLDFLCQARSIERR